VREKIWKKCFMAETKPAIARIDWRRRRGAATRVHILDAAVRCIVEYGYGALTTTMIANAAQVSRGAMLHHFPSKDAVLGETIRYLSERRLKVFEKMIDAIPRDNHRVHNSIELFWSQVGHPYFIAFFELAVAARTDKALNAAVTPCLQALDARGLELAQSLFSEVDHDRLVLGITLSRAVLEYLTQQHSQQKSDASDRRQIEYLKQQLSALYGIG
jgi:AcrR family transcriptional regulator